MEISKMKPEFASMSRHSLKTYLLAHRSDTEALSAYIQRISHEPNWVTCPALDSPQDLDNYPEFLAKVQREIS
jgi:hypothetical protein